MNEFERSHQIGGTLDELAERVPWPYDTDVQKRQGIWRLITQELIAKSGVFQAEFEIFAKETLGKKINYPKTGCNSWGYIANAADSVMIKFFESQNDYSCSVELRVIYSNGIIRWDVEDNGTGINEKLEPYIFTPQVWTTKHYHPERSAGVIHGGNGHCLSGLTNDIKRIQGSIGCENKGKNKGAIFWYEIPISSILVF